LGIQNWDLFVICNLGFGIWKPSGRDGEVKNTIAD
jgi:hypothetical protein